MHNACTKEFLNLKNPTIIKTILQSLDREALIIYLQRHGFPFTVLKRISKPKLIDEIIKTFDLTTPGCNDAKKEFYNSVLRQTDRTSSSLSNKDMKLLNELVNTTDIQSRRNIVNLLDENSLYILSLYFGIPNPRTMDVQELRNIFIRLSSKQRTPVQSRLPTPMPTMLPQPFPESRNIEPEITSPIVTNFLNAITVARRREILNSLNRQQLFILAKYFSLSNYKNQPRENIIKQLLYNVPPPNITSTRQNKVLSSEEIINGFRNSYTPFTRKEYLKKLDMRGLYILAERYGVSNYKKKGREALFNEMVYKAPSIPIVSQVMGSPSCNIPKDIQYFSEKESRLVKSFMNANTIESKKKFLNSLPKEDLMILAQKSKIYGSDSLNIAQLREQLFKNNSGLSLEKMFELAQNDEQRKNVLNFADSVEMIMLAKKYNIPNVNKMSGESIKQALYNLPYSNYKLPCYGSIFNAAKGGTAERASCTISDIQTPSTVNTSSTSLKFAASLPPPINPGDKIMTPRINSNFITPYNTTISSCSLKSTGCQTSPERQKINMFPTPPPVPSKSMIPPSCSLTSTGCPTLPERQKINMFPTPPPVPSKSMIPPSCSSTQCQPSQDINMFQPQNRQIISPSPTRAPVRQRSSLRTPSSTRLGSTLQMSPVKAPTPKVEEIRTSVTKSPLKIKIVDYKPSPNRLVSDNNDIQNQNVSRRSINKNISQQKTSSTRSSESFVSCNMEDEDCNPVVEITNIESKQDNLDGLDALLYQIYETMANTRKLAIENKTIIKKVLDAYLETNPIYNAEYDNLINTETYSFIKNGIILLGDEKVPVEEVKSRLPNIIWSTVNGVIGIGLVYLYGQVVRRMVSDMFTISVPESDFQGWCPDLSYNTTVNSTGFI